MKSFSKVLMIALACVLLALTAAQAANDKPGKGIKIQPARATWNTGFFSGSVGSAGAG
jgi:glycine betaine/proline transport system substrate-binding protein